MAEIRLPRLGPATPTRGWRVGGWFGRAVLRALRWSFGGGVPDVGKAVVIVAPHTSNWDFVVGAAGMLALDLEVSFLGKHTLFRSPFGRIMKGLGGIPVDRDRAGRIVEEMVRRFEASQSLLLALAPEGTRGAVKRWKTGFHRIASEAGVPIIAATLDYGRRQIRFSEPFQPTTDAAADVDALQRWFADSCGRRG